MVGEVVIQILLFTNFGLPAADKQRTEKVK